MSDLADRLEKEAKEARFLADNHRAEYDMDAADNIADTAREAADRLRKLEAGLIRTHDLIKQGRYQAADAELKALAACGEECEHGKSLNDYCEPCGRIHGGG